MAELKTASAQSTAARVKADIAADDLSAQVAALREDLARLSESVVALGQGAKAAVTVKRSTAARTVPLRHTTESHSTPFPLSALGPKHCNCTGL